MRRKIVCLMGLGFFLLTINISRAEETGPPKDPLKAASRVLDIADLVLQKHIDPPTRQEMILSAVRTLYRADKKQPPRDLSRRISELSDRMEQERFLQEVLAEFSKWEDVEDALTMGLLESLPGGGVLIDAKEGKVQDQLAANRYVGIGIALGMNTKEQRPSIAGVIPNGPAWRGGMKENDIILTIDGQSTESKPLMDVIQELRGEEGTEVTLTVRQPNEQESRELKLTRGRVFIPTVRGSKKNAEGEWQYTIDIANDIAFIRIQQIGPSTLHELKEIEAKLRDETIRGVILDLKLCGGILHDTVLVADGLLDGGVIGHVRDGNTTQTFKAGPGMLFQDVPMVVLVSRFTETAGVFLAAALQDQGRAIIVGEPTVGRRYVRSNVPIPGREGKIAIATAIVQRGDGTSLLGREADESPIPQLLAGYTIEQKERPTFILPDHFVASHAKRIDFEKDMLDKAIEVLRKLSENESASPKN